MRALTRLWLPLVALLAGLGWASMASAEYLVGEAGLRFPDQIGGAQQSSGRRYPQAGLGHGIDYSHPGYGASIYVYDRGVSGITDGIASEAVRSEFAQACRDIFAVQRQQNAPEPQLVDERIVKVENVDFLVATYRYKRGDIDTLSMVAVTGLRRHFIKVRISARASDGNEVQARFDGFLRDLGRLLSAAGSR